MQITKQIKPLSINECWVGKRFKTPKYKAYEALLLYTLPRRELPDPPFKVSFEFGFSTKAADIDNPVKVLVDILQKKYGFNDKEIVEMELKKKIVKKGEEYFKVQFEPILNLF